MLECFVALGGNLTDTLEAMKNALYAIAAIPQVTALQTSRLYRTSPLSDIPQPDFLNAVCRFETTLPPDTLFETLEEIERKIGKMPKSKNAPRLIDLDLLFYGKQEIQSKRLTIPHPAWNHRLFVLIPLSDVVENDFFNIQKLIEELRKKSQESVSPLPIQLPYVKQFYPGTL